MQTIKLSFKKGFTLIELIVVMAIFLFVIGVAISIFLSVVLQQKRVLSEQELLNQVSYAQEYMSKALRMAKTEGAENCLVDSQGADHPGYVYLLTRYDTGSGFFRGIKFINQSDNNACQEFFLDNTTDPDHPVLKELKNSTDDSDAVALTFTGFKISFAKFSVNGSDGSTFNSESCQTTLVCGASNIDTQQPRATILFDIEIAANSRGGLGGGLRIIQTTVSQRNLNINNGQR